MSSEPTQPPRDEYQRRLEQRRIVHDRCQAVSNRLATARGVAFLSAIAVVVAAVAVKGIPVWIAALPAGAFVGLVAWHQRVAAEEGRAARAVTYYRTALQRLDEQWAGVGATGQRYADPEHIYAGDLDLFGDGSLFQRLCRARTRLGEDRLAEWLCEPADADAIATRQAAVAALRNGLDFREDLALLNADVHDALDQNRLRDWSAAAPQPFDARTRLAAVVLSVLVVGSLAGWLFFGQRLTLTIVFGLMLGVFLFAFRRRVSQSAMEADEAASGLAILSQVLEVIERQEFTHGPLRALQATLLSEGRKPSQHIAKLDRLIRGLNNTLRNQFFAVFGFMLALPVHLVHAIEVWRQHAGPHIPEWLDVVAEFEAVVSLSGYAYEEPASVVPEIVAGGPCFDAEQIGHPLIPQAQCVRNDLHLGPDRQLVLISGSNMSGKSTLLRTVGVNTVLAQAGGPVRAKRLRLSPLRIASAMRVHDSLQDGRSLFYAVLRRIKAIVDATEIGGRWAESKALSEIESDEAMRSLWDEESLSSSPHPTYPSSLPSQANDPIRHSAPETPHGARPVLFLLDEILQGTNSLDRRIGAEGVIRTLVARGAIGLVTTHDLALTEITHSFDGRAINCHFQDDLTDGRMTFDYQLRPGVVEKSNALELMRSMGLDV